MSQRLHPMLNFWFWISMKFHLSYCQAHPPLSYFWAKLDLLFLEPNEPNQNYYHYFRDKIISKMICKRCVSGCQLWEGRILSTIWPHSTPKPRWLNQQWSPDPEEATLLASQRPVYDPTRKDKEDIFRLFFYDLGI